MLAPADTQLRIRLLGGFEVEGPAGPVHLESAKTAAVSGVGKKPGAIALQVTPWRDHSSAMARVSCTTPPFAAP